MKPGEFVCRNPLRDGSPCHSCRIHDALIGAERVIEPTSIEHGYINMQRCLEALGDAMAHFLAELDGEAAVHVLSGIYHASRHHRADHRAQDGLGHPAGHA